MSHRLILVLAFLANRSDPVRPSEALFFPAFLGVMLYTVVRVVRLYGAFRRPD